jgi:hypothetical protein
MRDAHPSSRHDGPDRPSLSQHTTSVCSLTYLCFFNLAQHGSVFKPDQTTPPG